MLKDGNTTHGSSSFYSIISCYNEMMMVVNLPIFIAVSLQLSIRFLPLGRIFFTMRLVMIFLLFFSIQVSCDNNILTSSSFFQCANH